MNYEDLTPEVSSTGTDTTVRPIGYWLRAVDALLTREFAAAFSSDGVSRREWMLLSILDGDIDRPGISERLARKGKKLHALEDRGWIERSDEGRWSLTDEGRAAKERLGGLAGDIRSRVAGAVSPEDYATTMASLEAIARELGWSEELRMPRRGHGRFGHHGSHFDHHRSHFGRRGSRAGFGHGYDPAYGPEHDRSEGHGRHEPSPCGERGGFHGHHRHGMPGHGGGHHGRRAEEAFERGFDAGYARGRAGDA